MEKMTVSFKLDRNRHDELAHMAMVESVHKRKHVTLSDLVRRALEHEFPQSAELPKTSGQ